MLEEYNIRGQRMDNIRATYTNSMSAIRTQDGLTEWFGVTSGVRHGCVLSPLLFIANMNKIAREANCNPEDLNEMLFANNQSLVHEKEGELQEHTNSLNTQCENFNMKISISETETMKVSRTPGCLNINIDGTTLKQVSDFKYLGSIFTEDGHHNREIETGVQKANSISYQLAPLLRHPNIPINIKAKLIKSIFRPNLTYQSQTWTLTKNLERKITTYEMHVYEEPSTKPDAIRSRTPRFWNNTNSPPHQTAEYQMVWAPDTHGTSSACQ